MMYYIDRLYPTIQALVSNWRDFQSQKTITFSKLILKARDKETACRERLSNIPVMYTVK